MWMGIIDSIGKVFQWRKELPYPIFYSYIPPRPQVFPQEIGYKMDEKSDLCSSWISIENLSDRVLKDIRIKMPTKLLYDPIVEADKWEFNGATSEIKITAIDPQEIAYIVVFPCRDQIRKFIRPKVIIGDQLLNNSMQKYGYIRKHPWNIAALTSGVFLELTLFASPWISLYMYHLKTRDVEFVESNLKSWEPWSWSFCQAKVLRGSDINEKKIRGNKLNVDSILLMNRVNSIDQLLEKEAVIVCK